jgi:acetyl esterase
VSISKRVEPAVDRAQAAVLKAAMALPERVQRRLLRRPVVIDGLELAPELQLMLRLQGLTHEPALGMLPRVEDSRSVLSRQLGILAGKQPVGRVRDLTVDGAEGPLHARLYTPTERLGGGPSPTLLFLHGGGMALGDVDAYDAACRHLAEHSGVQLLSLDYRLAPEHPFPAPTEDCLAAYRWLVEHAGEVGADPDRLGAGGDSAGGHLAAATAILAAEAGLPMAFQLVVYPVTDWLNRSRSRDLFDGGGFVLERAGMDRCTDWYLPDPEQRGHPLASVLLCDDLPAGLAPAYVATAGFDPLRDEGEAYARKLADAGVAVELERFASMTHGFLNFVGVGRETRANATAIAAKLRAGLGT